MQFPGAFRRLRVLHRQLVPRHSSYTLSSLTRLQILTSAQMMLSERSLCNCQRALFASTALSFDSSLELVMIPKPVPDVKRSLKISRKSPKQPQNRAKTPKNTPCRASSAYFEPPKRIPTLFGNFSKRLANLRHHPAQPSLPPKNVCRTSFPLTKEDRNQEKTTWPAVTAAQRIDARHGQTGPNTLNASRDRRAATE